MSQLQCGSLDTQAQSLGATSLNTANNDAPFIMNTNYGCRSMLLLTEYLSFKSSQKQCVVCRDVSCHLARFFCTLEQAILIERTL